MFQAKWLSDLWRKWEWCVLSGQMCLSFFLWCISVCSTSVIMLCVKQPKDEDTIFFLPVIHLTGKYICKGMTNIDNPSVVDPVLGVPSGQDARHHRHWQGVLYRVSGLRLTTLPVPLPDSGTVLGGSLELHGKTISLACFHGVNFRSKSWALFSLQEPYINFTSEVQEVPGDRKLACHHSSRWRVISCHHWVHVYYFCVKAVIHPLCIDSNVSSVIPISFSCLSFPPVWFNIFSSLPSLHFPSIVSPVFFLPHPLYLVPFPPSPFSLHTITSLLHLSFLPWFFSSPHLYILSSLSWQPHETHTLSRTSPSALESWNTPTPSTSPWPPSAASRATWSSRHSSEPFRSGSIMLSAPQNSTVRPVFVCVLFLPLIECLC